MQFVETCMGLRKGSLEYWVIMKQQLFKYVRIARRTKMIYRSNFVTIA